MLKKNYNIDMMLNDGGRIMSNGFRDVGILCEERVTLEPEIPHELFLKIKNIKSKVNKLGVLGKKGLGLDKCEIKGAVLVHSTDIGNELANVYVYPLDDKLVR